MEFLLLIDTHRRSLSVVMEGAGGDAQYTFAHFIAGHKSQLDAGGVPPHLWPQIYKKLLGEVCFAIFILAHVVRLETF